MSSAVENFVRFAAIFPSCEADACIHRAKS